MADYWGKYIQQFLDYLIAERNDSPYTKRNYGRDLEKFAAFARENGITTPVKVEKLLVRSYLNQLSVDKFARSSIARNMSALRSFFRYLNREEIMGKNPAALISSPKLDKRLPAFLTQEEAERLVESPDLTKPQGERDRAMLEMLYATGMRVSELVSMDIKNINFESNEVRVWGKGNKERIVLLGGKASQAITDYINHGRKELLAGKKSNALFVNRYGVRLLPRRVQKLLKRYSIVTGKRVHPHKLRHTFATHLLDGGADLKVVQELLGHADLSSTQIYTHISQGRARKIYLGAHPMSTGEGEKGKTSEK
jgi:integrase/recombinase XerC